MMNDNPSSRDWPYPPALLAEARVREALQQLSAAREVVRQSLSLSEDTFRWLLSEHTRLRIETESLYGTVNGRQEELYQVLTEVQTLRTCVNTYEGLVAALHKRFDDAGVSPAEESEDDGSYHSSPLVQRLDNLAFHCNYWQVRYENLETAVLSAWHRIFAKEESDQPAPFDALTALENELYRYRLKCVLETLHTGMLRSALQAQERLEERMEAGADSVSLLDEARAVVERRRRALDRPAPEADALQALLSSAYAWAVGATKLRVAFEGNDYGEFRSAFFSQADLDSDLLEKLETFRRLKG